MIATTIPKLAPVSGKTGRWLAVFILVLLGAPDALAQENKEESRKPGFAKEIPYDLDPNIPGLSREERVKRAGVLRTMQVGENKRRAEEERGQRLAQRAAALRSGTFQAGFEGLDADDLEEMRENRAGMLKAAQKANAIKARGNPIQLPGAAAGPTMLLAPGIPGDAAQDSGDAQFKFITFYLSPASVVVQPGEIFVTACRLLNLQKLKMDRIELILQYPTAYLEPVSLHQDNIKDFLEAPPEWGIDRNAGEIRYSARFAAPLSAYDFKMIDVVWRALRPSDEIEIAMESFEIRSGAYLEDTLLTVNEFGDSGPVIGAVVRIIAPSGPIPSAGRILSESIGNFAPAAAGIGVGDVRPPRLWIDYPRADFYDPGQWIIFDIHLDNPDHVTFDELHLALQFDPDLIEFADTDTKNWIRRGVNVLDGPFRERWNWDLHLANEINQAMGRIEYRMGQTSFRIPPSGILMRAAGRIKSLARDPLLTWIVEPNARPGDFSTGIYLLGENLLDALAPGRHIESPFGFQQEEKADPALYRFRNR